MDVRQQLDALATKLDRCRVRDESLRRTITAAHAESEMPADARIVVVIRPPAPPEALSRLEDSLRRHGRTLPADLRDFLRACDGLWMQELTVEGYDVALLLAEEHYEAGVWGAAAILRTLEMHSIRETAPDGRESVRAPPVIPFFDVPDQGWHAVAPGGIVTHWFDAGSNDAVIAPSFTAWLSGWIASGFDTFWQRR